MNDKEVAHLREWIGREEQACELLTPTLVERFEATLGRQLTRIADEAPVAIHWCLHQPAVAPDGLGRDGHPARGGFLPPVPLPRRMWAGGELSFLAPLRVGDEVTRISRIADVAHKQGRTGELVFVTVEHEVRSGGLLAIRERQDIVYRAMETGASTPVPATAEPHPADHSEQVEATTTLLFRYSALTFNGHRIHYDLDYARDEEGYAGLVVHGPLQATLLLHLALRVKGATPARFAYRGVAPLILGRAFSVNAVKTPEGFDLWTAGEDGITRMRGVAQFPAAD
ncbi:FAS1-like dehydratase domain-containing protein [Mesorhizobium sp. 1B3]|uniref:FAS1-like dehydratase domain-containing protein n=1 Tax=Mesorhizobium sp. 1B3 TaxID=3243599 RepID=UPI003D98D1A6